MCTCGCHQQQQHYGKKTCEMLVHVGILFTFYFMENTLNCQLCIVVLLLCGVE